MTNILLVTYSDALATVLSQAIKPFPNIEATHIFRTYGYRADLLILLGDRPYTITGSRMRGAFQNAEDILETRLKPGGRIIRC